MSHFMMITKQLRKMNPELLAIDATDLLPRFYEEQGYTVDSYPGIYPPSESFLIEAWSNPIGLQYCLKFTSSIREVKNKQIHVINARLLCSNAVNEVVYIGERCFLVEKNSGTIINFSDTDVSKVDPLLITYVAGFVRETISVMKPNSSLIEKDDIKLAIAFAENFIMSGIYTLSFLGCKNIDLEEVEGVEKVCVPRKNPNKFRHRNVPFRYHVLRISKPGHSPSSPLSGAERMTAMHICRGHVKRYTDSKPLFGKHVGAFYFSQHSRGDKEIGVVSKDYKVVV